MVDTRKLRCYSGQSRISEPKLRLGGRPSLTAYTRNRKEQQTDEFRLVLYAIGTLRMPCRRGIPPGSRTDHSEQTRHAKVGERAGVPSAAHVRAGMAEGMT